MRSRAGLVAAVVVAAALMAALLVGIVAAVASSVAPDDRETLEQVLREQALLIFWIWVLAVVAAGALLAQIHARYISIPHTQAMAATVIATTNPAHRLPEQVPGAFKRLAAAVNQLADAYERSRAEVTERVAETAGELERERNRLAALMSELSVAVLVCNSEGRILLYNTAARQLFDRPERSGSSIGLGRSVFAVLDRNLVAYALDRVTGSAEGSYPVAVGYQGRLLRARITAVGPHRGAVQVEQAGEAGQDAGFVVTVEDMTRIADASQNREVVLRTMTRDARAALAAIRAAVENVLDYPEMDAEQQGRFLAIISEEATRLGTRLEESITETADQPDETWAATLVSGRDLVDSLARGLARDHLPVVAVEPQGAAGQAWLTVDGFAVQHLLSHLLEQVNDTVAPEQVGLRLGCIANFAELDLTWTGRPVEDATLRTWTAQPLPPGAPGPGATYQEVIDRHGGEIWTGTQSGSDVRYVRLLLPLTRQDAARRPAGSSRVSGNLDSAGGQDTGHSRDAASGYLATYDFSLLTHSAGRGPWQDRPLAELSFTVFDTETTGLQPQHGDEIISIGAIRIVNGKLLRRETFDQLIDPRRSVPQASVDIHGIRPELLVGQPTIEEVLPAFAAFAEETVLVGHNVAFDLQFLARRPQGAAALLALPVLDTLLLSPVVHPEVDRHALEDIAGRLGINVIGRHTALGDALVTGEVFLALIQLLADRGITTVAEAQDAARRTYQAKVSETLYAKN